MARVAATGVRVEADAAVRARDLGEDPSFAIATAEALIARVEACARGRAGRSRRRSWPRARAELARAAGHDDPALWTAARSAWEALGRPYRAAQAQRRKAEALLAGGDARRRGGEPRCEALAAAQADRRRVAGVGDRGLRAARAAAARARRAFAGARADRHGRRRRPVRAHAARAPGARAARRRAHEPGDRRGALHGREDRVRPRLADPLQARRALPHRGRGAGSPRRSGLSTGAGSRRSPCARAARADVDREQRGGDEWFPHAVQCAASAARLSPSTGGPDRAGSLRPRVQAYRARHGQHALLPDGPGALHVGHRQRAAADVADGDTVVFETRDVSDNQIGPGSDTSVIAGLDWDRVYPLAGPVASRARRRATRSRSRSSTCTRRAGAGRRSCPASACWPTTSPSPTCGSSTSPRATSPTSATTS